MVPTCSYGLEIKSVWIHQAEIQFLQRHVEVGWTERTLHQLQQENGHDAEQYQRQSFPLLSRWLQVQDVQSHCWHQVAETHHDNAEGGELAPTQP